jgi:putative alpha-1,2-mannosidase
MSSWLVWAALGMYPLYPGRAEFVLGSPLFERAIVNRPGGRVVINARGAEMDAPFVGSMSINGVANTKPWLSASFAMKGGALDYVLTRTPNKNWAATLQDAPPSFGPKQGRAQH